MFPAEDFRKKKTNTVTNTFLLALFDRPYFVRLDLRSTQLHKSVDLDIWVNFKIPLLYVASSVSRRDEPNPVLRSVSVYKHTQK